MEVLTALQFYETPPSITDIIGSTQGIDSMFFDSIWGEEVLIIHPRLWIYGPLNPDH
jgi:hypothetical protein